MQIGFLTCPGTHPGSDRRREDAYEHDVQVAALRPAMEARGMALTEIDWRAPIEAFADFPLVLVGTPWDYQDDEAAFLAKLDALESSGHQVCNPAALVRWNARKTYLKDMATRGAATISTIWLERANADDIARALDAFDSEALVAKRQVGAGAEGQSIHHAGALDRDWAMEQPMMLQPYLDQITSEGENSFLFIDGSFSHALVKRAAAGDYRVQSIYGGTEEALTPSAADLAAAQSVVEAVPFATPLYARIDMVRGDDGALLLMEAEMIEPYLYPEQGPRLGAMMAEAIERRLG